MVDNSCAERIHIPVENQSKKQSLKQLSLKYIITPSYKKHTNINLLYLN